MSEFDELYRILDKIRSREACRKVIIEFKESLSGTPKRFEMEATKVLDIAYAIGLLFITYIPDGADSSQCNTEIVHLSDIKVLYFDSIQTRSLQPF